MHDALRRLFTTQLAHGGRVLLSDPFRAASLPLLQTMEGDGWAVALSKWTIDTDGASRPIGVFELAPPDR